MFQKSQKDCTGNKEKFYFQCINSQDFQYRIPKIFNFSYYVLQNCNANT